MRPATPRHRARLALTIRTGGRVAGMTARRPFLPWIVAGAALVVIGLHNAAIHPWMPDDAFISFRYAENLSAGNGLVFNPGERVEGYTSFLWVALLAIGNRIGFDTVVLARLLSG